jgi:hypothetical protein
VRGQHTAYIEQKKPINLQQIYFIDRLSERDAPAMQRFHHHFFGRGLAYIPFLRFLNGTTRRVSYQ